MQKPTYTYYEMLEHIKHCNADTLLVIIELLCEEGSLYVKTDLQHLYVNVHYALLRFTVFTIVKFSI